MKKLKKNGNYPVNARINIKYNENKPKISFSYPDKLTQQKGSFFYPLKTIGGFVGAIMSLTILFLKIFGIIESLENYLLAFLLIFGTFYYILPIIIYALLHKQLDKFYPRWQGFWAKKKYHKFKVDEVIERDGRIFCELPVFNNIVLDFKCKKDFSDYLEELDITEYKFSSIKIKRFDKRKREGFKIKRKKVKRRKVNELLWYARFYFKQKPKKGYLEVIYC